MELTATRCLDWYLALRTKVWASGYAHEIDWAQSLQPITDPDDFWREFAWVVLNSGMKNQVAQGIWHRVRPVVETGGSAHEQFGHKGKADAIDYVWGHRVELLDQYQAAPDKLEFLRGLPWIGAITCWHLAKNYGLDVAKPDRHLVRIAGAEGPHAMCARLACESGDRVATVDLVIWRAANMGWV